MRKIIIIKWTNSMETKKRKKKKKKVKAMKINLTEHDQIGWRVAMDGE